MEQPLVTVGVASYNNEPFLRETLESIRNQTYKNFELIIVDDASSDNSAALIKAWQAEFPEVNARFIQHTKNSGICPTFNDVVRHANGEFICIIGSDDMYYPDKLAVQVPLLQQAPAEVGVVFSLVDIIGPNNEALPSPVEWEKVTEGKIFLPLLTHNFIPAMGALIKKKCFDTVGLYDENLVYEDADMWLRIAKEFEFIYSPRKSAIYRRHSSSFMSSRQIVFLESTLLLFNKHWGYSAESDKIIKRYSSELAERIYRLGGKSAPKWLRQRFEREKNIKNFILWFLSAVGLPGKQFGRIHKGYSQ